METEVLGGVVKEQTNGERVKLAFSKLTHSSYKEALQRITTEERPKVQSGKRSKIADWGGGIFILSCKVVFKVREEKRRIIQNQTGGV